NAVEDKKRVWNKVDSYYVEDGNTISIGDILLDNEGDLLYFNNIN
ncbi:TPA: type I-B CRISPR-associated protein Cas5, partial [Clostridioides difficile]|nr:type I-B CRISPR-associated protein Cas5 [Clostridioides difficile]